MIHALRITAAVAAMHLATIPGAWANPLEELAGLHRVTAPGTAIDCAMPIVVERNGTQARGTIVCAGEVDGGMLIREIPGGYHVLFRGSRVPREEPKIAGPILMSSTGETVERAAPTFHGACREGMRGPRRSVSVLGPGNYLMSVAITDTWVHSTKQHVECTYTYYDESLDSVRTLTAQAYADCGFVCGETHAPVVPWAFSLECEITAADIDGGFSCDAEGFTGPYAADSGGAPAVYRAKPGQETIPYVPIVVTAD